MTASCHALSRVSFGMFLMAYGFALCYDGIMDWIDQQKREGR